MFPGNMNPSSGSSSWSGLYNSIMQGCTPQPLPPMPTFQPAYRPPECAIMGGSAQTVNFSGERLTFQQMQATVKKMGSEYNASVGKLTAQFGTLFREIKSEMETINDKHEKVMSELEMQREQLEKLDGVFKDVGKELAQQSGIDQQIKQELASILADIKSNNNEIALLTQLLSQSADRESSLGSQVDDLKVRIEERLRKGKLLEEELDKIKAEIKKYQASDDDKEKLTAEQTAQIMKIAKLLGGGN